MDWEVFIEAFTSGRVLLGCFVGLMFLGILISVISFLLPDDDGKGRK